MFRFGIPPFTFHISPSTFHIYDFAFSYFKLSHFTFVFVFRFALHLPHFKIFRFQITTLNYNLFTVDYVSSFLWLLCICVSLDLTSVCHFMISKTKNTLVRWPATKENKNQTTHRRNLCIGHSQLADLAGVYMRSACPSPHSQLAE